MINSNDEHLIDWEDGITWDDFDEEDDIVEEYEYKTEKDLAIARAKKAQVYINNVVDYLTTEGNHADLTVEASALKAQAAQLLKNLNIFE